MSDDTPAELNTLVVRDSEGKFCEVPVTVFSGYRVTAERQAELENELNAGQASGGEVAGYNLPAFDPTKTYGYIPLRNNGAYLGSLSLNNQSFVIRTNQPAHLNPHPGRP